MWIVIGFAAAVVLGSGAALLIARGPAREDPLPWNVVDLARLQASIMGMLGGVSITGIVLAIGFLSRETSGHAAQLDTVTLMFAIAFSYFVQTAFTLSYLPDRGIVGEQLFRFYYSLASTLQLRTVLLLSFALIDFAELSGLTLTVRILVYLMPFNMIAVLLVIAVVADSLGQIRFGECYLAAAVGLVLAGACYAAARWLGIESGNAELAMALAFATVNGLTYVIAGLVPLAPRRPKIQALLTRHARRLTMIDMQTTITSLLFLWLAVIRAV